MNRVYRALKLAMKQKVAKEDVDPAQPGSGAAAHLRRPDLPEQEEQDQGKNQRHHERALAEDLLQAQPSLVKADADEHDGQYGQEKVGSGCFSAHVVLSGCCPERRRQS